MGNIVGKPFGIVVSKDYDTALEESVYEGNQGKFYLTAYQGSGLEDLPFFGNRNVLIINGNKIQGVSYQDLEALDSVKKKGALLNYKGSSSDFTKPSDSSIGDVYTLGQPVYQDDVLYPMYSLVIDLGQHSLIPITPPNPQDATVTTINNTINYSASAGIGSFGINLGSGLYAETGTIKLGIDASLMISSNNSLGVRCGSGLSAGDKGLTVAIGSGLSMGDKGLTVAIGSGLQANGNKIQVAIGSGLELSNKIRVAVGRGLQLSSQGVQTKIGSYLSFDSNQALQLNVGSLIGIGDTGLTSSGIKLVDSHLELECGTGLGLALGTTNNSYYYVKTDNTTLGADTDGTLRVNHDNSMTTTIDGLSINLPSIPTLEKLPLSTSAILVNDPDHGICVDIPALTKLVQLIMAAQ